MVEGGEEHCGKVEEGLSEEAIVEGEQDGRQEEQVAQGQQQGVTVHTKILPHYCSFFTDLFCNAMTL